MSILLLPVAPLSHTKSRLRDCFSQEQLKDLTIAMFKDLGTTLTEVNCFKEKVVYCSDSEILELAEKYGLVDIKEKLTQPRKSFDDVINDLNRIAVKKFNADLTVFTFLDILLISAENFREIHTLIKANQLVVCPAIHSAGISILGRNPPDIVPSFFSDPHVPSFVALLKYAREKKVEKVAIYDSFRAGFDIDIKQDLIFAFEYLKIFNLTHTETYKFLKNNLKLSLQKLDVNNNRKFKILDRRETC
jgi:2-phospho-L-lactate guanylyltransferase (CobY/MobA/RfbA family)